MGATIGGCLVAAGHQALWVGEGRSDATRSRAEAAGMTEVASLEQLAAQCDAIVAVCPPAAAAEVAGNVHSTGFDGLFIDANAVSPATGRAVLEPFTHAVDGGIVGPPVHQAGTTRLYMSGDRAEDAASLFAGSDLEVRLVDGGVGAASAVKMCFAAWTKGTSALLFAVAALAESEGVADSLAGEWTTSMPDLLERARRSPARVGPKAWRFAGEMEEIASTFAANDLPDGFHLAAADIYERLASLKDPETPPELEDVIALLLEPGP